MSEVLAELLDGLLLKTLKVLCDNFTLNVCVTSSREVAACRKLCMITSLLMCASCRKLLKTSFLMCASHLQRKLLPSNLKLEGIGLCNLPPVGVRNIQFTATSLYHNSIITTSWWHQCQKFCPRVSHLQKKIFYCIVHLDHCLPLNTLHTITHHVRRMKHCVFLRQCVWHVPCFV